MKMKKSKAKRAQDRFRKLYKMLLRLNGELFEDLTVADLDDLYHAAFIAHNLAGRMDGQIFELSEAWIPVK